ncbi:MAG: archaemetzincin [Planctomycetota bacterium]|nr:archaemetzincin [Planctomycetota bacterium]
MGLSNSNLTRIALYGLVIGLGVFTYALREENKVLAQHKFKMPTPEERKAALGSTKSLPPRLKAAVESFEDFEITPTPKESDWLTDHPEFPQGYDNFVKSYPNRPDKKRNKLYFQPIGDFPKAESPSLLTLKECATLYFGLPVIFLDPITVKELKTRTRINNYSKKKQLLTDPILNYLHKNLPKDAYCCLGITMEDLYPGKKWNFVFGIASLTRRVGVYSFARYDPKFYGNKRGKDWKTLILQRACKVLVHETGHMFGYAHCIYFNCVEAGANHLEESDSQPMHFCPICLRKLYHSKKFNVYERYKKLHAFFKKNKLKKEEKWVGMRLKRLDKVKAGPPK